MPRSPRRLAAAPVYGDADGARTLPQTSCPASADPGTAAVAPRRPCWAISWRHVAREIQAWPSVAVLNRRGRIPSGPLTDAYTLRTEVEDLLTILDDLGGAQTLFGWSYGGLIALMAANERPFRHVVGYEPVIAPFARPALPALRAAAADQDWDRSVEIVNTQISGFTQDYVQALRADQHGWSALCLLSEPLHAELEALNASPQPDALGRRAERADLILGESNNGTGPYGTAFEQVRRHIGRPQIHVLPGQGHLAHIFAPRQLAHALDDLARPRSR